VIRPSKCGLADATANGFQPGLRRGEHLLRSGWGRELDEEVGKRVQHDGARAQLLRHLRDGRRGAFRCRLWLGLILLLDRGEDHQRVLHTHGLWLGVGHR
jgi:hypothetical protein